MFIKISTSFHILVSPGKTVQAIAAMSAYRKEWPLLVLTPSSARYHWEAEIRQWLKDVDMEERKEAPKVDNNWDGRKIQMIKPEAKKEGELEKEAVNVLTSGKSHIFRKDGKTKAVIVSYGLIVSLINNQRITPGMFKAIIVDESHALKNKASKRTIAVLPLLKAASRRVLLSGTPALARPSELWPQISALGDTDEGGDESGLWIDEAGFYSKYVRGDMADENASKARYEYNRSVHHKLLHQYLIISLEQACGTAYSFDFYCYDT
jgi:SWI/SNF-related matrix-associated actin-dependent regulator 1 of chromatin subfamily A